MSEPSFGARISGANVEETLALESTHEPAAEFATLDDLISRVVRASLVGKRIAQLRSAVKPYETLEWNDALDGGNKYIAQTFDLTSQQGRGAWFLPDEAGLTIGWANWPHHFDHYERYACGVAHEERGKIRFASAPSALFVWAIVEPLFEVLYRPLMLRGPNPLGGDLAEQRQVWTEVNQTYTSLGIQLGPMLEGMGFGRGWGRLRASEQIALKRTFREALRAAVPGDIGARYRVWVGQGLVQKYYAKATRGAPSMRKVLTKALHRPLAGVFGGDWLSFLTYLGETPSPGEQISTALPEPRLYVGASSRAAAVAAQHGVPAKEVERMLATLWSSGSAESPVHRRIAVLREYWNHFDSAHARQAPGMTPLWGFAETESVRLSGLDTAESGPAWYHPGQYRRILPGALLGEIEELWDGLFIPSAPDRTASSSSPYGGMLDAFGPALRFWHGIGLTTWFLTEGPYSRTDLAGLEDYHARDLEALASLETPVDKALFAELLAAERYLGAPKPYTTNERNVDIVPGFQMSTSMTVGSRRSGFELLRNVVTTHRRAWAAKYLDAYLRMRWESELRVAAREYARFIEVKGKAPTGRQFAKFANAPTNHWFGGDVNALYAALGEKAPGFTQRVRLLPREPESLALQVFYALGGSRIPISGDTYHTDDAERARRQAEWGAHYKRKELAELSVKYTQLREAFGRRPTVAEVGRDKFEYLGSILHPDPSTAWMMYNDTVDRLLPLV